MEPHLLHIPLQTTNVKLVLIGTPNAGIEADILQGYYLVGRHSECQIRPKSSSVSERHCLLEHGARTLRVFDLQSEAGTFVNEDALVPHQWRDLQNGDILRCGKVQFKTVIEVSTQQTALPNDSTSANHASDSVGQSELKAAFCQDDVLGFLDDHDLPPTTNAKVLTRTETASEIGEVTFNEADSDAAKANAKAMREKRKAREIPKPKKLKTAREPIFSTFSLSDPQTLKRVGLVALALTMISFFGYRIYKVADPDPVRIIQEDY